MDKITMETVPAVKFRQNLGEYLNRVKFIDEVFIIERGGKPLAAIVPLHYLERLKKVEETPKIKDKIKNKV